LRWKLKPAIFLVRHGIQPRYGIAVLVVRNGDMHELTVCGCAVPMFHYFCGRLIAAQLRIILYF
jgi:hypothetical protein